MPRQDIIRWAKRALVFRTRMHWDSAFQDQQHECGSFVHTLRQDPARSAAGTLVFRTCMHWSKTSRDQKHTRLSFARALGQDLPRSPTWTLYGVLHMHARGIMSVFSASRSASCQTTFLGAHSPTNNTIKATDVEMQLPEFARSFATENKLNPCGLLSSLCWSRYLGQEN